MTEKPRKGRLSNAPAALIYVVLSIIVCILVLYLVHYFGVLRNQAAQHVAERMLNGSKAKWGFLKVYVGSATVRLHNTSLGHANHCGICVELLMGEVAYSHHAFVNHSTVVWNTTDAFEFVADDDSAVDFKMHSWCGKSYVPLNDKHTCTWRNQLWGTLAKGKQLAFGKVDFRKYRQYVWNRDVHVIRSTKVPELKVKTYWMPGMTKAMYSCPLSANNPVVELGLGKELPGLHRIRSFVARVRRGAPRIFQAIAPKVLLPSVAQQVPPQENRKRLMMFLIFLLVITVPVVAVVEFLHFLSDRLPCARSGYLGMSTTSRSWFSEATFAAYYFIYNAMLCIMINQAVALRLLNPTTGLVWELWGLWYLWVMTNHVVNAMIKFLWFPEGNLPHPASKVIITIMPFIGNDFDLARDYTYAGVCFVTAHCYEGYWSYLACTLGWLALLSIFAPLPKTYRSKTARAEHCNAHWPILALESKPLSHSTAGATADDSCLGSITRKASPHIVTACTQQKEILAWNEDLPQAVNAAIYCVCFGGSIFIIFTVTVSISKILLIPYLRRRWLPDVVPQYCDIGVQMAYVRDVADLRFESGKTMLHDVSSSGNMAMAKLLVVEADIDARDEAGHTALHMAVEEQHAELVRMLLEAGADINATSNDGKLPIHRLVAWRTTDQALAAAATSQVLLNMRADVNSHDKNGNTVLHEAVLTLAGIAETLHKQRDDLFDILSKQPTAQVRTLQKGIAETEQLLAKATEVLPSLIQMFADAKSTLNARSQTPSALFDERCHGYTSLQTGLELFSVD